MRSQMLLVVVVALSGCFVPTTEAEQVQQAGRHPQKVRQAPHVLSLGPSCTVAGETCSEDSECCEGSFCSNFTYAPPVCKVALTDGSYCETDAQCQTGACRGSVCGAACADEGIACHTNSDCCDGTFCFNDTYAPWVCKSARADGVACSQDRQCVSGHCSAGLCGTQCGATGDDCTSDDDCCAGSFCRITSSYVPEPSTCAAASPAGAYCNTDRQCTSLRCTNHACTY